MKITDFYGDKQNNVECSYYRKSETSNYIHFLSTKKLENFQLNCVKLLQRKRTNL